MERLIVWAESKRLVGPLKLYRSRLADEELRLMGYAIRHHRTSVWAQRVFQLSNVINPPRRTYPKGAGARYRRPGNRRPRAPFRFSF